ncbi:MFS transporter, partial [Streptomyces sp. S3(2020)]|uniref:MFS transporter n=1 Tax=Streptomyces sp. S3(2020) TaxID=2732044 RepID=UPI001489B2C3
MTRFSERTITVEAPAPAPLAAGPTLALTSAATAVALMTYTAPMVTLPDIAAALHTPLSAQAWLLNGTPLGLAALLLVAGSLADDYGRRRIFVAGTLALGLTTVLGAFASTTWLFTLARIAQGAASAALLASSLGLIVHAYPTPAGRLRATGGWGAFVSGGIAVGPIVTGAMPSWRLSYVVLGAAAVVVGVLSARALPYFGEGEGRGMPGVVAEGKVTSDLVTEGKVTPDLVAREQVPLGGHASRSPRGGRPDIGGAVAFGSALVALVAALTLGRDGWLRAPVGLLLLASLVLLALFVMVERRAARPMIDLGLLRRPRFLASSVGGLFTGLAVIGLFSFLPALLQQTMRLSPMDTAWLFLLWSGLSFAVALQVRRLSGRVHPRLQLTLGFLLHAAGVLTMLGSLDSDSWTRLLPGLIVAGVGSGLLNAALPLLAVESVPAQRAAMGSGAQQTLRYVGSCAGVALTIALATSSGGGLARGADVAMVVSAGLAVVAG